MSRGQWSQESRDRNAAKKDLSGGVEKQDTRGALKTGLPPSQDLSTVKLTASGSSAPPAQNNLPVRVQAEPPNSVEARESTVGKAMLPCNPDSATPSRGLSDSRGGQNSSSRESKAIAKRYEYWRTQIHPAVRPEEVLNAWNAQGSEGWRFCGVDSAGYNVFCREVQ